MLPPPPEAEESKVESLAPPAPLDGFAPEEFAARRAALRESCSDGIILIRGSTEDEVPHGLAARFRQNSSFFYLTGVDTPGAYLLMLPASVPAGAGLRGTAADVKEMLFLPARDPAAEVWTGPKLGPGEATEKATGITKAFDVGRLWAALSAWLFRNPLLYTAAPWGETARGTREYAMMHRIADAAPVVQFRDASPAIAALRVVKSPAEIERMRQAIAITADGQRAARAAIASIRPGVAPLREYDVEAEVFRAFRSRGAVCSFASIVGGGINGTTLHYEENSAELNSGDLVVVDVGARFGHYCGDLSRTYAIGGPISARQREIYALVLKAHENAVAEFQPGQDTLDILAERCKKFLKDSPLRSKDFAGKERTMDLFMPHGLGHFLGMDVHDVGDREPALGPGNVITIEPGLYLPSERIGVRIEDDYLITETGMERLYSTLDRSIGWALGAAE